MLTGSLVIEQDLHTPLGGVTVPLLRDRALPRVAIKGSKGSFADLFGGSFQL